MKPAANKERTILRHLLYDILETLGYTYRNERGERALNIPKCTAQLRNFYRRNFVGQSTNTPANTAKLLTKPTLTWMIFNRALLVFGVKSYTITIRAVHNNGRISEHTLQDVQCSSHVEDENFEDFLEDNDVDTN
jgi:hypothetical protein